MYRVEIHMRRAWQLTDSVGSLEHCEREARSWSQFYAPKHIRIVAVQ